jgi:NAD(P)H-hydrate epimerase
MNSPLFRTTDGLPVPALTAAQMREVDRIAVEEFGLALLQMMENAGRALARTALDMLEPAGGRVVVLAGSGGNGGGGLCCARHLHNWGVAVSIVLSKAHVELRGAARAQLDVLRAAGVRPIEEQQAGAAVAEADLTVDALIGYSLRGAPQGRVAALIALCNRRSRRTLSLDVPSGLDATTGQAPGAVVRPERTLTLALPKTGLRHAPGALALADIGIPPEVYLGVGVSFAPMFGASDRLELQANGVQGETHPLSTEHLDT